MFGRPSFLAARFFLGISGPLPARNVKDWFCRFTVMLFL